MLVFLLFALLIIVVLAFGVPAGLSALWLVVIIVAILAVGAYVTRGRW